MNPNWRSEPATKKQKLKLQFFGHYFREGMTKGQASDAIDECVKRFPKKNAQYYSRAATEDQLEKLRGYLKADGETPEDYSEEGKPLSYQQAKDLIWECEFEKQEKKRQEKQAAWDRENLVIIVARTDFCRSLTRKRVKEAAKLLDYYQPGWVNDKNGYNLLLDEVAGLYPELAEKEGWIQVLRVRH